ncbi:MAG: type transport system ATP-binding protein [Actinomycetota bacterium]|jgi:ABC-2 type transport system ATP-binding protein|nr:type transport system ATP-binding protein [Actinomycetota bacterium]
MPPDPIVEIDGLWKTFGQVSAVEDLSFTVERGQVYGLLGPNGAGKTTSLRVLMGLERPTRGTARLFGERVVPSSRQLARVGAMVEQAAFVPHLSGMRNLRLWWEAGGARMQDADLDGALAIAGLDDAIDRKVKTYSQGMKQRLGFARLLLGRPELLVLDEPTNGLDPGEIREIRELITRLSTHGATVLLSSHHLSEVEQVCSHVLVMNRGRLVADGTVSDLVGAAGLVYVEVDDRERARALLSNLPSVAKVQTQGDGLVVELRDGQRSDIATALVGAGLRLETIMPTQQLEEAFLEILAAGDAARSRTEQAAPA